MSGGAYEYLCFKDVEDLFQYTYRQMLRQMADRLIELGYAEDAARETEELICIIEQAFVRIDVRRERLHKVWHAVEWWASGDWGEDEVKGVLAEYRGEGEKE